MYLSMVLKCYIVLFRRDITIEANGDTHFTIHFKLSYSRSELHISRENIPMPHVSL